MRRAFEAVDQASWTEAELNTYESSQKAYWDYLATEAQKQKEYLATIQEYEVKIQESEAKIQESEARGEARGINLTAINMLKKDLDDSLIMEITGISKEELDKLKHQA